MRSSDYDHIPFDEIACTVGAPEVFSKVEAFQIRFLRHHGLQPEHYYLDLGCGILRGGLPLVEHLEVGHYFGIDIDQALLDIAHWRVRVAGLEAKRPTLMCQQNFADYRLPVTFDFILAYSVFIHLTDGLLDDCLALLGRVLKDSGTAYANVNIGDCESKSWKNRFPVIWRPFDFYADRCRRHGLRASLLPMVAFEKEHWTKHDCLVIAKGR